MLASFSLFNSFYFQIPSHTIIKGLHALYEVEGRPDFPRRPYYWYDRTVLDEEEQSKVKLHTYNA